MQSEAFRLSEVEGGGGVGYGTILPESCQDVVKISNSRHRLLYNVKRLS